MFSRRRFLELSGVTAGMATASPWVARASSAMADGPNLPPSIAKLKSRKNEAVPITREERQQRQERARKLMAENAIDAIVLMEGTSLKYFTGIRWWGGERTFALVLPVKGGAFYVVPDSRKVAHGSRLPTLQTGPNPTFASGRKMKVLTSA